MFHHEENATRKLPRRPKRIVTFEEVRDVYHLRLEDAYKKIGCTQKDVYKVINHQRMSWPRPEIIRIQKRIDDLVNLSRIGRDSDGTTAHEIEALRSRLNGIYKDVKDCTNEELQVRQSVISRGSQRRQERIVGANCINRSARQADSDSNNGSDAEGGGIDMPTLEINRYKQLFAHFASSSTSAKPNETSFPGGMSSSSHGGGPSSSTITSTPDSVTFLPVATPTFLDRIMIEQAKSSGQPSSHQQSTYAQHFVPSDKPKPSFNEAVDVDYSYCTPKRQRLCPSPAPPASSLNMLLPLPLDDELHLMQSLDTLEECATSSQSPQSTTPVLGMEGLY